MPTSLPEHTLVRHARLGQGHVVADLGPTIVVDFPEAGLQRCARSDLELLAGPRQSLTSGVWGEALPAVLRAQALAIRSTNDRWGVFSRSRVNLLPHQLWVCSKVLASWPTRWLVADDVGLGKTIEAGLILTPLLASGRVRRLLILTPASLAEQWQHRMREMFDIRMTTYAPASDTPRADYWNTQQMVIASAQTMRLNRGDRWRRLLEAQPWDMLIVDEAHHLGASETGGATLTYELVQALAEHGRLNSMLFFTGTPHRGKNFEFFALLRLLRPDVFDPRKPTTEQLPFLRNVMIRNNKQSVTDMDGVRLFKPVRVKPETYVYSEAEKEFYRKLTAFILTGRAYAEGMRRDSQRAVMLVLTTMQKLAASSIAAVRRALEGRLARLKDASRRASTRQDDLKQLWEELEELAGDADIALSDRRAWLEDQIAELLEGVQLNPEEVPALQELLVAASKVDRETRIERITQIIERDFPDRSVLLFTEYKATQALMVSALSQRYGSEQVTFINGDEQLVGVQVKPGQIETKAIRRDEAARRFNSGQCRFLVSTEAAGEGIDLQENCSALIHVDIPWNPMRMHQRVGRLSRYGQTNAVDVVVIHNPETVESRVWQCLEQKLDQIVGAMSEVMDDPEDLRQLVLGMTSSAFLERLYSEAKIENPGDVRRWFDARTVSFGGQDVVSFVRDMFGSVARFDFQTNRLALPRVDLPDLAAFFKGMLRLRGRRVDEEGGGLSFITPDEWKAADFAIMARYQAMRFDRKLRDRDGLPQVLGAGHRLFEAAIRDAEERAETVAAVSGLESPMLLFTVQDKVSTQERLIRRVVFGVEHTSDGWVLHQDWQVVVHLNKVLGVPERLRSQQGAAAEPPPALGSMVDEAETWFTKELAGQDLPFQMMDVRLAAVFVPVAARPTGA